MRQERTGFQQKVWQKLLDIPYGTAISYSEFAKQLGDEKLMRTVGAANSKNKLWIVVPCHRIVSANRSYGLCRRSRM
ncbi:MAG: methylated-DNA--[protein]-cysteine S-methyltransferase [Prevotellaceae bacterium]|nr:methylated-DNA--[protein]-cysteine S-methyltransferase [Prevotellaceae bacterium]